MYRMEELQEVIQQEETLRLRSGTYEEGIRIGQIVFDLATSRKLAVCCQVVLAGKKEKHSSEKASLISPVWYGGRVAGKQGGLVR